jgi:hypothetical protein
MLSTKSLAFVLALSGNKAAIASVNLKFLSTPSRKIANWIVSLASTLSSSASELYLKPEAYDFKAFSTLVASSSIQGAMSVTISLF